MTSSTPQEPKEIKGWRRSVQEIQLTDHPFDWDSFVLWYGNKLPKYLWGAWNKDVRPIGFTWQKFMRLLRYRTDIGVMWYKGVALERIREDRFRLDRRADRETARQTGPLDNDPLMSADGEQTAGERALYL